MPEFDLSEVLDQDLSILFVTGAGISLESGIPTYRGVGGLYNDDNAEDGKPIEEIMSAETWQTQPELTWKYLRQISDKCRGIQPNLAHKVIAELERKLSRVWVLTQNVDGLHQAAGSENVIPIHGDAQHVICLGCDWETRTDDYSTLGEGVPSCPECGGVIRPRVVLFNEMLPDRETALYKQHIDESEWDIVVSVGTTHTFPYIDWPLIKGHGEGAITVQINPTPVVVQPMFVTNPEYDVIDVRYKMGAVAAFTQIAEEIGLDLASL